MFSSYTRGVYAWKVENALNNIGLLPSSFETNLKTIKIYGFSWIEKEMIAINFLLQVVFIEKHNFITCKVKKDKYVVAQIEQFSRASLKC